MAIRTNLKLQQIEDTVDVPLEALDDNHEPMLVTFKCSIVGMFNYMTERPSATERAMEDLARMRARVITGKREGPLFMKELKREREALAEGIDADSVRELQQQTDEAHRKCFARNVVVGWEGLVDLDTGEPYEYSEEHAVELFSGRDAVLLFGEVVGAMTPRMIEWSKTKEALAKNSRTSSGSKRSRKSGGASSTGRRKKSTKRKTAKKKTRRGGGGR